MEPFFVPQDVYDHMETVKERLKTPEEEWKARFALYCEKYPEMKELWDQYHDGNLAEKLYDQEEFWAFEDKPQATRNVSGELLNRINQAVPNLFGGSADLAPSNKTALKGAGDFSKEDYSGKNLHFGVREQAMAAIGNGLALPGWSDSLCGYLLRIQRLHEACGKTVFSDEGAYDIRSDS